MKPQIILSNGAQRITASGDERLPSFAFWFWDDMAGPEDEGAWRQIDQDVDDDLVYDLVSIANAAAQSLYAVARATGPRDTLPDIYETL